MKKLVLKSLLIVTILVLASGCTNPLETMYQDTNVHSK
jgi:hypothetical protein